MIDERLPELTCSCCGEAGNVVRFQRVEQVDVRGFAVTVTKTLRRCEACHEEFENSHDPDWRVEAYDAFRRAKGWVTSDTLRTWRSELTLSQPDVTRLLGWGDVTLGRYERGSLQSEAHNAQLSQLMAEGGISRALAERPDALSAAKKAELAQKLGLPSASEIRAAREKRGLSIIEATALVDAGDSWAGWEEGSSFPDARASRLIRLIGERPEAVAMLREAGQAAVSAPLPQKRLPKKLPSRVRHRSDEAKALWSSLEDIGFVPRKLRALFPAWLDEAEGHHTAAVEIGAFTQMNIGVLADYAGAAKPTPIAQACLKANRFQTNPAHRATLAITIAVAHLVARATMSKWSGQLSPATKLRDEVLRSTNRGWVDFENLSTTLWARGIPVVYLPDLPVQAKGMDGLVTRAEGRPVIIICKKQPLSDWALFISGHETGHIGREHLTEQEGSTVIDTDAGAVAGENGPEADIEAEANEYAELLVAKGERLTLPLRIPGADELANTAIQFGAEQGISPGHCVLNAMRHTQHAPFNLGALTMSALKKVDEKLGTPRTEETCRRLALENLNTNKLPVDSLQFLQKLGVL